MWRRDRKNFNAVSFSAMCGLIGALLAAIGCVLIREAVRRYAYEDLRIVFLIVWVLFIVMAVPVIMIAVSGLKEGMKLRRGAIFRQQRSDSFRVYNFPGHRVAFCARRTILRTLYA